MVDAFWKSHHFTAEFPESQKTDVSSQLNLQLNGLLAWTPYKRVDIISSSQATAMSPLCHLLLYQLCREQLDFLSRCQNTQI